MARPCSPWDWASPPPSARHCPCSPCQRRPETDPAPESCRRRPRNGGIEGETGTAPPVLATAALPGGAGFRSLRDGRLGLRGSPEQGPGYDEDCTGAPAGTTELDSLEPHDRNGGECEDGAKHPTDVATIVEPTAELPDVTGRTSVAQKSTKTAGIQSVDSVEGVVACGSAAHRAIRSSVDGHDVSPVASGLHPRTDSIGTSRGSTPMNSRGRRRFRR